MFGTHPTCHILEGGRTERHLAPSQKGASERYEFACTTIQGDLAVDIRDAPASGHSDELHWIERGDVNTR